MPPQFRRNTSIDTSIEVYVRIDTILADFKRYYWLKTIIFIK